MSLKDEWKQTGKGLGHAFASLGKNIGRSAETVADKVDPMEKKAENNGTDSTVFNDGSWRNTGKELGNAFTGLGKSILHSAKKGLDCLDGEDNSAPAEEKNGEKNEENKG